MSGTNYTQTTNYGFFKPIPNADVDAWGDHWNTNADNLDSIIHGIDTRPAGGVQTWNTRTGAVTLQQADVTAVGFITSATSDTRYYAATNPAGYITQSTGDGRYYASSNPSGYVNASAAAAAAPVQSVSGHTGTVSLIHSDISDWATSLAPYAPLASPTFSGAPSLPTGAIGITQTAGTSNTSLATTAFVGAAITAGNFAPLSNPVFVGDPQAPTAALGDNDTSIATTAFVTRAVGAATGGATVSDTAPTAPQVGALWFDSAGAQMYVWENDGNSTQWVPVVNQSGALSPAVANNTGRNLVQNAVFAVAQRGAGPWSTATYTVDRWVTAVSLDTINVSQLAFTVTGGPPAIGDESAQFCLQNTFTGNAGAGAYNFLTQRIEGARRLSNKTVTVSFWGHGDVSHNLGVSLDQFFGTGGSPSASVILNGQSVVVTATWTRYSLTFTLPSVAGKTFGTNGDDYTNLNFWCSSGATNNVRSGNVGVQSGTIQLWGIQLELGTQATPLDKGGTPQQQLSACQRFYQQGSFSIGGYATGNVGCYYSKTYAVPFRASPTLTSTPGTQTGCSGTIAQGQTIGEMQIYTVATAAYAATGTFTASADL